MGNSQVIISNGKNKRFSGTGFVIYRDIENNFSYVLTCAHVIEEILSSILIDNTIQATVVAIGSSKKLDLAVLKIEIIDREPLLLLDSSYLVEGYCDRFKINGFKDFTRNNQIYKPIGGRLNESIEIRPQSGEHISGWEVTIDQDDQLVSGYSGSPLICEKSGKVIAIVSHNQGKGRGYAIAIENLKTIWENVPHFLMKPRIFISTSYETPYLKLATHFEGELEKIGYDVFLAPNDLTSNDEDWSKTKYKELNRCDYFLLFLSEESITDESVYEEVKKAVELQKKSKSPKILPIKVNINFSKNDSSYNKILELIKNMNMLLWKNDNDTPDLVERINRIIIEDGDIEGSEKSDELKTLQIGSDILETGAVPIQSSFYIERKEDLECYENLQGTSNIIKIKGPQQYGLNSILLRIKIKAKEQEYNIVEFNFQDLEKERLSDLEKLLDYFCQMSAYELDKEVILDDRFIKIASAQGKATKFVKQLLSLLEDKPLLIIIQNADRLFDYIDVSDSFFGVFRAWFNNGEFSNLKMILSYTTEPLLEMTNMYQSPLHNLGSDIRLKPFNVEELKVLANSYGMILSEKEINEFKDFTGGYPYLSRKIFHTVVKNQQSLSEVLNNPYEEDSINTHLRRYLWILEEKPDLKEILKKIVRGIPCGNEEDKLCYLLESTGLIINTHNEPEFSCKLYKDYFYQKLS